MTNATPVLAESVLSQAYSNPGLHKTMLRDKVRMKKYYEAIRPEIFKGKLVLDVGCGSGILSMWAAEAGASKVYAVENSPMAVTARKIIKQNGLDDIITVLNHW